jgi:hypothetical protein
LLTCPWIFPYYQHHLAFLKLKTHCKPIIPLLWCSEMSSVKSLSVTDSLSIQGTITASFLVLKLLLHV